jgi:hypothetical protein
MKKEILVFTIFGIMTAEEAERKGTPYFGHSQVNQSNTYHNRGHCESEKYSSDNVRIGVSVYNIGNQNQRQEKTEAALVTL